MKYICSLIISVLTFVGCQPVRKETRILLLEGAKQSIAIDMIKTNPKSDQWDFMDTDGGSLLSEEFPTNSSAIVMGVKDINALDYKAFPRLKRYLEAGGGGIVIVRDTVYIDNGHSWIKNFLEGTDDSRLKQDAGRLALLGSDHSTDQLVEALEYAIGANYKPNFKKATTLLVPDKELYQREVLAESLDEPMQLAILPNGDVLFVERKGAIKYYGQDHGEVKQIAHINVFSGIEDGLLGMVLDPKFAENNYIYLYYAVAGDKAVNRLSRFQLKGEDLILDSESIVLEIPTQRKYCCHSAGYLAFDKDGSLYLSTGDNTNAEETEGYTPVDERPGRHLSDDQATAANTDDLRGNILRIKPLPEGGYEIPEGNLFPKDGLSGRPEIYVMGARNPYRYSIDPKNGYLYFGDVGPDTKAIASTGEFMSFDEINQVREPGFFGWPYFLGNNEIFPKYDFDTKELTPGKDPSKPINASPNNTGERELPAATPAMIWYGKGRSAKFPLVGSGGASLMAGPVFYNENYNEAPYKLSDYYDGKLFIYEWIRGWIMAVTFDEEGNYQRMEPFLDHLKFDAPVDMQFAPDGSIYILEYGTNWFSKNTNAKLVRLRYMEGNKNPIASMQMDKQYGAAPMNIKLSAESSKDQETEAYQYIWSIDGQTLEGHSIDYTFKKNGVFEVQLNVIDKTGAVGKASGNIYVGNSMPEITIHTNSNRSFYWDDTQFNYDIEIIDKEEEIDPKRIHIAFGYIARGNDVATILSTDKDVDNFAHIQGKQLVNSLDCKSCHSLDKESVGPTYLEVAERYREEKEALSYLSQKIIAGGSGNWGERAMSPHPALAAKDVEDMVNYILSLGEEQKRKPSQDTVLLNEHLGKGIEGAYLLNVSYKDNGANGIEPLQGNSYILLKNSLVQAEDFDQGNVSIRTNTTAFQSYISNISDGKYIKFNSIDLTHIKKLVCNIQAIGLGGVIELRSGKIDGDLLGKVDVPARKKGATDVKWTTLEMPLKESEGEQDLYFVFKGSGANLFHLDWIRFFNK
ncbi:hypothetical protein KCTC52924_02688 [Arenibacter antarcticus]